MNIFLSYAAQDRSTAAAINRSLLHEGHDVFFDRDDLPPGEEFHARIRRAIEGCRLFVFLISEAAIDARSYSLTELEIAQQVLPHPHGRLLPVLLEPIGFERLPPYAKSVSVLQTEGDITAAVLHAVDRIARTRRLRLQRMVGFTAAALALAVGIAWLSWPGSGGGAERVGLDGATAVLIPAGTFIMGDAEYAPRRQVFVPAFYLDRYETTTARYAKFLAANGSVRPPDHWEAVPAGSGEELPVSGVDWHDAAAYCAWAGRRLPTEAEWEKAARGTDERRYPWGNESPTLERANYQNASPVPYDGGLHKVGGHPKGRSPHGIDDMAGNVNEWVADWYAESFPAAAARNPKGPEHGTARVIRGGGRFDDSERLVVTRRYHARPETRAEDIGFRCAKEAP